MELIGNIIGKNSQNKPQTRFFNQISWAEYKTIVNIIGNNIVKKNNPTAQFIIDDNNKDVLNQFYYYITGSNDFKGNLHKGIMLVGGFGGGKTTLIRLLSELYGRLNNRVFTFISAIELTEIIKQEYDEDNPQKHISYYEKRPLIIDEVGKENKSVMVYGTLHEPMKDLITMRYNNNAFTLGTTNYSLKTLTSGYGEYLGERLLEMFNFIELKGNSRRK